MRALPKSLATMAILSLASAGASAQAQGRQGTLEDLRQAHQLCYEATNTSQVDRTVLTDQDWKLVGIKASDGTITKSDSIYYHDTNPSFIVVKPGKNSCHARTLFEAPAPIDEYVGFFEAYNPRKKLGGAHFFCAEGRVAGIRTYERDNGILLMASYSTQVETGRCLAS